MTLYKVAFPPKPQDLIPLSVRNGLKAVFKHFW